MNRTYLFIVFCFIFVYGGVAVVHAKLAGDLNSDGTVNSVDWSIMQSQWLSSNPTPDLNSDGIVNSIDFSILNQDWGQTEVVTVPSPTPPPPTSGVATLVRTTDSSQWLPSSPDSTGIVYLNHSNTLLISDSEVNEIPALFTGDNLFETDLRGNLLKTLTTLGFSDEPTGVAYNPANRHLFISDDNKKKIFKLNPGPDGLYDTSDDIVTTMSTSAFGSNDPEGITYNTALGVLHLVDGVNTEVYTINPGANGIFDGVPADGGDDQVTSFDTSVLGVADPEGIAYDSDFGHLYIAGQPNTQVVHVTTMGVLVRRIDVSAANADKLSGLAYAPSSVNSNEMNLYIVDRGVDNNTDPKENDGKVYELSMPLLSGDIPLRG